MNRIPAPGRVGIVPPPVSSRDGTLQRSQRLARQRLAAAGRSSHRWMQKEWRVTAQPSGSSQCRHRRREDSCRSRKVRGRMIDLPPTRSLIGLARPHRGHGPSQVPWMISIMRAVSGTFAAPLAPRSPSSPRRRPTLDTASIVLLIATFSLVACAGCHWIDAPPRSGEGGENGQRACADGPDDRRWQRPCRGARSIAALPAGMGAAWRARGQPPRGTSRLR